MQVRIPELQSEGEISTRVVIMNICSTGMAIRQNRSHFRCIGSAHGSALPRLYTYNETINVATAMMGVNPQAIKPGEIRPSKFDITIPKEITLRRIIENMTSNNQRRQFGPDTILNKRTVGSGPEIRVGRKTRKKKTIICTEPNKITI